jgi:hypothetical protein
MRTLFEDAWDKVVAGITTLEEVIAKVPEQYIEKEERSLLTKERLLSNPSEKAS